MAESKQTFRDNIREIIMSLSKEEKIQASENIFEELQKIILQQKPDILISHEPLEDEVDIRPIHDWFKTRGKVLIIALDGTHETVSENTKMVILVPGRAFTKDGKRIGRGGGYYDKFLKKYPQLHAIGVCFASQIFENLPQDSWDIPVSQVVFG